MDLLNFLLAPVIVIYTLVMSALLLYVFNFFYLAYLGWRERHVLSCPTPVMRNPWPRVTIQLPIYNEWYVVTRLIESAAALDYPPELLEIHVLDDSTDETAPLVAETVERMQARGVNILHLHRAERRGFKAGALADGFKRARGEFIAVFDADFVPQRDFLRRMLPHFDNQRVAFVQARWGHLNRHYSFLTLLQSLTLDAHFAIDQLARSSSGFFFNFNGTAGIWRKAAIADAGGWRADTFAEDLDLSYRVFLRGWDARYAGEVEVPAELPVSFTAFRRQQFRWARGGLECALIHLPVVWRAQIPLSQKIQASLHLTGYGLHFLVLALIVLYPLLLALAVEYPTLLEPIGIGLFMNFVFFAPTIYFAVAQHILKRRWLLSLPAIFLTSVVASGMVLNTLRAALQILQRRVVPFDRTPKYGITQRKQNWDHSRYSSEMDGLIVLEIILSLFNLWTAWTSWHTNHWFIMIYTALFAVGLLFASVVTLLQTIIRRVPS